MRRFIIDSLQGASSPRSVHMDGDVERTYHAMCAVVKVSDPTQLAFLHGVSPLVSLVPAKAG